MSSATGATTSTVSVSSLVEYDAVKHEVCWPVILVHAKSRAHAGQTIRVTPKDAEKLARLRRVADAVH